MSWWEEEEEQIRESDSVWERLRNQPIYSPPQSPTSFFLISPQLFFSQPPPLTPRLHFSPPPTTSVLMSPHLDFSPPPPPRIFPGQSVKYFIELKLNKAASMLIPLIARQIQDEIRALQNVYEEMRLLRQKLLRLDRLIALTDTRGVALKYLNKLLWWLPLELNTDFVYSFLEAELSEPNGYKELFEKMTQIWESLPLECFLPPKSTKMVSIWSCLSVVKISRKISIRLFQVLPSVQLPQTLQIVIVEEKMTQSLSCSGEFVSQTKDCSLVEERSVEITVEVDATNNGAYGVKAYENFPIVFHSEKKNTRDKLKRNYKSISEITREDLEQNFGSSREDVANSFGDKILHLIKPRCIQTPLHARSSPRTIALLDGGEMVQLDSSKQQSLVEFDITNNSAHLVRASQSCSTVSHSDETNSRETLKRKCTTESFEDLQQHIGCKRDAAAKALGVSVSTVKRTCRQHGIPQWPSRKKKKVSEMDNVLVELEGEKNVSPTCKTPTVGTVLDFIEGPNLSNTENRSNEESITTPTFQDSFPVFERDCILLEPQGEKNVSPTHKTPTNWQTEVGNGMVGHIQDQNGIVTKFIDGPNLLNSENRSNEKSLTTPNFQDYAPGNYPAMDFSISSTYRESGEAGGSSKLAFQPKELTASTACPNPNACVFTQPHISLRDMLIDNVGSSRDSRNFSTSALGFFMGEHVSQSSWTMPWCSDQAPMQTMTTIPHTMPHVTEKQDIRTVTFKAQYGDNVIKFRLSLPSGIVELKKEVTNRLGELGSFRVHYQDNDNEWILIGCDTDVWDCFELSCSSGNEVVRLLVRD